MSVISVSITDIVKRFFDLIFLPDASSVDAVENTEVMLGIITLFCSGQS